MKKVFCFLIAQIVWVTAFNQISERSIPVSFQHSKSDFVEPTFRVIELQQPDSAKLNYEDQNIENKTIENRIGLNLPLKISFLDEATVTSFHDGNRIFRLGIVINDAKAIGLYFSQAVEIPFGATLHAYNSNKRQVLGAYTSEFDGFKALEMVQGDLLVLEYFAPANTPDPVIEIKEAVYFYRGIEDNIAQFSDQSNPYVKAGTCQVDVACSEGNNWQNQSRSVVFYTFSSGSNTGSCTGSMINNTAQNCKPYILTANHCGGFVSGQDVSETVWYWMYQKSSCNPGNGNLTDPSLGSLTMTGGIVRASSMDGNLDNNYGSNEILGTDFLLIELSNRPPSNYQAFLSGWDKSLTGSNSGVAIHHPDGSAKKIATYTSPISEDQVPIGMFWLIGWSPTSNGYGIAEGGSSGAPLYNSNFQIIGQISWSIPASCSNPQDQIDGAGMFSTSWESNGTSPESQLKPWLDPIGSGVNTLIGRFNTCSTANISEIELSKIRIFPNPSQNIIQVEFGSHNLEEKFELIDELGRQIKSGFIHQQKIVFDLNDLSSGVYFIKVNEQISKFIKL